MVREYVRGTKLAIALVEAVGLDPKVVLDVNVHLPSNGLATLTFRVLCTDETGKVIIENEDIKTEIRTWKETA